MKIKHTKYGNTGLLFEMLVKQSDVVLLSLKLAVLLISGLRYEDLREWNSSLIYLEHAPYGPKGPFSQEGGYDVVAAGMSGLALSHIHI